MLLKFNEKMKIKTGARVKVCCWWRRHRTSETTHAQRQRTHAKFEKGVSKTHNEIKLTTPSQNTVTATL